MTSKNEEKVQEKLYEFQLLQNELKSFEQQIAEFEERKLEMEMMKQTIDEIKNKEKESVMVPLGSGVFMNASIKDDKTVFVNVGNGVVVRKKLSDAKEIIDKQIEMICKNQAILENSIREIESHLQKIIKEVYPQ
ncbi:MAG: prefoldin subunit alpha [Candidatus Nanoarchaeia archaeon]|nr:prefoldin subunit alpha [Candidatus Nanoarchaeia archaeon]